MQTEIELSRHASLKLKERRLRISEIEKTVKNPDSVSYDLISKTLVAVRRAKIDGIETNLIVPFVKTGNVIKVVTVYPCRDLAKEIDRKEGTRWVRIK
ncbi:MAG: DUF4258 domain-containing protein [bacterium]